MENEMTKQRRAAPFGAACVIVGVLALTGCGLTERPDEPGVTQSADGEIDPWLGKVCGAIDEVATVANKRNQLDWKDVSDAETAPELISHLRRVETELDTALTTLESASSPPVDDGETILSELRENFEERQDAVADAAEFIEGAASRIDPLSSPQIASAAQSAYTAAPRLARQIEGHSELRDAYEANPACTDL